MTIAGKGRGRDGTEVISHNAVSGESQVPQGHLLPSATTRPGGWLPDSRRLGRNPHRALFTTARWA